MTDLLPVFDGHNDILLRMFNAPQNREAIWLSGEGKGHLDLPRMAAGGFAGGMFAIYVPSAPEPGAPDYDALMENPPYAVDLPKPVPLDVAQGVALAEAGHLLWMERASGGRFKLCRTAAEIEAARAAGVIAVHNHPSGNLKPSQADLSLTQKLVQAGKMLDLPVLDHLIVSEKGYFSFADEGKL